MSGIEIGLLVVVNITSLALIALVLLHKGKGGGLSDMFVADSLPRSAARTSLSATSTA